MSILDAEQSARYIDSLVASVQALEAERAAYYGSGVRRLKELEADLRQAEAELNGNLERPELLNRYGRRCYDAGVEQAQARIAALEQECRAYIRNPHDSGVEFAEHVLALLAQADARGCVLERAQTIDVEAMRSNLHATFNGGHEEPSAISAFHHGMDTVCNVLAAYQRGERTNGILPQAYARGREEER